MLVSCHRCDVLYRNRHQDIRWIGIRRLLISMLIGFTRSVVSGLREQNNTKISRNISIYIRDFISNKKVLLRERKRHTARRVVSTPSVVLPGYPPRGGVPGPGYPPGGVWVPPTPPPQGGYPDLGTPPGGGGGGGYLTRVPPLGGTQTWVPPRGGYLTWVPPGGTRTWVPPRGT